MSYTRLLYHIIFRTKHGMPTIPETSEKYLYHFIWGFVKKNHSILYRINGMPDHIHLFIGLHQSVALADFVKRLKLASSLYYMKNNPDLFPDFSFWSVGYCALTYGEAEKDKIIRYIRKQKSHHNTENFIDEVRRLLIENRILYEPQYFESNL